MRRLLIRPGAIGDCLLCFPAMQALRSDYTEVWVPTALVPLVDFAERACAISSTGLDGLGFGSDAAVKARLQTFDEVVSWYGANRPEFREVVSGLGVHCVFYPALPPLDCGMHAMDFFCMQISNQTCRGSSENSFLQSLFSHRQTAIVRRGSVIFHPFSGSKRKNWPLSKFQELARHLHRPLEWLAGPDEELPEAQRYTDLRELARWIVGADLYIGNDSGITHMASALGVPTIALFGSTDPSVWAPRGPRVEIIRHDPITELPIERVGEAASNLLACSRY